MIIKRERVQVEPGRRAATVASGKTGTCVAPATHGSGKQVRLLREEDVVRAVELTCSCGEVTLIELSYADPRENGTGEDTHE